MRVYMGSDEAKERVCAKCKFFAPHERVCCYYLITKKRRCTDGNGDYCDKYATGELKVKATSNWKRKGYIEYDED